MWKVTFVYLFFLGLGSARSLELETEAQVSVSNTGFTFKTITSSENNVTVLYDCSGNSNQKQTERLIFNGENHPCNGEKIIVRNCKNVTVVLDFVVTKCLPDLEIQNIKNVILEKKGITQKGLKMNTILISDVETLKFASSFYQEYNYGTYSGQPETIQIQSLFLKNVGIDVFDSKVIPTITFSEIYLSGVRSKILNLSNMNLKGLSQSHITIRDSHFEDAVFDRIHLKTSKVEIFNNSFGTLSFNKNNFQKNLLEAIIGANDSFTFTDNYVGKIYSFPISSPKISITWNTFDDVAGQLLALPDNLVEEFKLLNISRNTFNRLNENFLKLNLTSGADIIQLEGNYLNCSCKNWAWLRNSLTTTSLSLILFFKDYNNNQCVNFGNCTLSKVAPNFVDVCADKFVCLEDEIPPTLTETHLNDILLTLKNMVEVIRSSAHREKEGYGPNKNLILEEVVSSN